MLVVWALLGFPAVFYVLGDQRLVVPRPHKAGWRDLVPDLLLPVVLLPVLVLWPAALAKRDHVVTILSRSHWLAGAWQKPPRWFTPLPPWRVTAYRLSAVAIALVLAASAWDRGRLWVAVPTAWLLVTMFANKSPSQRRQVLGLSPS